MSAASSRADVYYNGTFIKETRKPEEFIKLIKERRRKGLLPDQLNIGYFPDYEEIRINTDPGRARRPLIVVENGKPKLPPST